MAVIRLGDAPTPAVRPARWVELGVPGLVALAEAAGSADLPPPPPDLLRDDGAWSMTDLRPDIERAAGELGRRGVLVDGVPTAPIAADLRAMATAPRRLRLSLAGTEHDHLGYWWVGDDLAGGVVRDGARCRIGVFDAGRLGAELVATLPDPAAPTAERLVVPVDSLAVLAALREPPAGLDDLLGTAEGVPEVTVRAVADWCVGVRAVLHAAVLPPVPGAPSRALIWFLHRTGWWSARVARVEGRRVAVLEPAGRRDLVGAVAELTAGWWS
ncbi:MAG TPA: ESX secretion-associated protein EspG [Marmoricola sp.]